MGKSLINWVEKQVSKLMYWQVAISEAGQYIDIGVDITQACFVAYKIDLNKVTMTRAKTTYQNMAN